MAASEGRLRDDMAILALPHPLTQGDRWPIDETEAVTNDQQEARDDLLRELGSRTSARTGTDLRQEWARWIG